VTEQPVITFNAIHKRFVVLYKSTDMRRIWKKVRTEFEQETGIELPKRFKKYPELFTQLADWIEKNIAEFVAKGGEDIAFYNKADLLERGWDNKLLIKLYPAPDKVLYLGRGRYAYYYNGTKIGELEDSEEFIEYIAEKLERKRKREASKIAKEKRLAGFGSEFIR
jgi:hypothetical protein